MKNPWALDKFLLEECFLKEKLSCIYCPYFVAAPILLPILILKYVAYLSFKGRTFSMNWKWMKALGIISGLAGKTDIAKNGG